MSTAFNYRHLYYFWVVGKEGGMSRAAARLDVAVQTISTQVRELEQSLGYSLLRPEGRGVALTEAGKIAMQQADQIFQLGEQLPIQLRDATTTNTIKLSVGISETLPKTLVHHLLQPILSEPGLRLQFVENSFDQMLAKLALHKLDVVLADRPAAHNPNMKLYNHLLGHSPISWYACDALAQGNQNKFPQCLNHLPALLPSASAAIRTPLDAWFEAQSIRPNIVAEFDDSALLKAFGASGMGVFPAPTWIGETLKQNYRLQCIGQSDNVDEYFYAIGAQKRLLHPLIQRLLPDAQALKDQAP